MCYLPQKRPADHGCSAVTVSGVLPRQRGEGEGQKGHVDVLGKKEKHLSLYPTFNSDNAALWMFYVMLTSCFIRHLPSSVSSSVGWAGDAVCTESIIMSSSTRAHLRWWGAWQNKNKQIYLLILFFFLPSISSLFVAGSGTFLEIQLTARRERRREVLRPHNNFNILTPRSTLRQLAVVCHVLKMPHFILLVPLFSRNALIKFPHTVTHSHTWKLLQHLLQMLKVNLQRRSSTSLVTRRTKCSSNISCVTWLSWHTTSSSSSPLKAQQTGFPVSPHIQFVA